MKRVTKAFGWVGGLVLTFHAIVGLVLARGLRRGALLVTDRPPPPGILVRSLAEGTISLEAIEEHQEVGHPGVIGLRWPDGYGQAGRIRDITDDVVTREFIPMMGSPPVCVGMPDDCVRVGVEGYAYPDSPHDVGLDYEEVTYTSQLGPMESWLVPAEGHDVPWAILVHGWTAERREFVRMLPTFHRLGMPTLIIGYRNDPGLPSDPTGHHRFGLSEWADLEAATRHVTEAGASRIVYGGASTGGAIVLAALERSELVRQKACGLYFDSPNATMADTVRQATAEVRGGRWLVEVGMWVADLRWDVDWEAIDYASRAGTTISVPTLVFHGTADPTVPVDVSRRLAANAPGLVDLIEVPNAGHVMSWNADPEFYSRELESFLARL